MTKSATEVPAPSDVQSVDRPLSLSESYSGAEGEITGDEGQRLEENNLAHSRTNENEEAEQTQLNELAQAHQNLAKDLESKQRDIDNRTREVETSNRELEAASKLLEAANKLLEAANKLLETRQPDIQRVRAQRNSELQTHKMQFDMLKQMFNLPPSFQLTEDTQHLVIKCFHKHRPLELRCFVVAEDCVVFSTLTEGTVTQWTEEAPLGTRFKHDYVPWFDIGIQRGILRYLELDNNASATTKWLKARYPRREVTADEARELSAW